ncbi:hypothetical protein, variant 4 [Aphanomyces astaci]|nr:hypothetical protein, variant 4 [Aphanomyces astaci]ETV77545.1 hypothetical protein, variant 4 [Aphanomyces astaci]|eukprot:XP_009832655.1 hypothetical protein, variant 4 [Aphanomyces astaci]
MITKLKDCRKLYLANLSHGILTRYTWETFKVIVWRNFDIKSSLIQGEYPSRMRCHRQSMHTCLPQSPRTLQSIRHQLCHVTVQETPIPPAICVVNYRDDYSNGSTTAGLCFLPYFRSLQNPCMC